MFVQFKIVQVDLVKTYNFFVGAGRKASKKQISVEELKNEVFEVLRSAPNKPGGSNYMKVCFINNLI